MKSLIEKILNAKPRLLDAFLLGIFTILVTLQPYYLHHEVIMMETGIHLPSINALFHGMVPFRDFYYLRGPLEMYVPAFCMLIFGKNSALLPTFYYVWTILTLLFALLIAFRLFRTRFFLYIMIPVFIARTFPRISFYYWGGMRYALGMLALFFAVLFYHKKERRWMFWAGVTSSIAFLTSIETAVALVPAFVFSLMFAYQFRVFERKFILQSFGLYALGFLSILLPYVIYLASTQSLIPFLQSMYVVVKFNHVAYPGAPGIKPETLWEFILALWPGSKFFKFMTPVFCYMAFAVYAGWRVRAKKADGTLAVLVGIGFYSLILYAAAFRKIEGHHFEMALQPMKFIQFFLLEEVVLLIWANRSKKKALLSFLYVFIFVIFMSSVPYVISRFSHRFPAYKWIQKEIFHSKKVKGLSLLEKEVSQPINLSRIHGMTLPRWQAEEIEGVTKFLQENTTPNEAVFCYPEVGNFNFWADRPFIGRFPIPTFTWMYEPWHQELMADFNRIKPEFVVMTHLGHRTFPSAWYFRNPKNIERFNTFTDLILSNYTKVKSFESVAIYKRN